MSQKEKITPAITLTHKEKSDALAAITLTHKEKKEIKSDAKDSADGSMLTVKLARNI